MQVNTTASGSIREVIRSFYSPNQARVANSEAFGPVPFPVLFRNSGIGLHLSYRMT